MQLRTDVDHPITASRRLPREKYYRLQNWIFGSASGDIRVESATGDIRLSQVLQVLTNFHLGNPTSVRYRSKSGKFRLWQTGGDHPRQDVMTHCPQLLQIPSLGFVCKEKTYDDEAETFFPKTAIFFIRGRDLCDEATAAGRAGIVLKHVQGWARVI